MGDRERLAQRAREGRGADLGSGRTTRHQRDHDPCRAIRYYGDYADEIDAWIRGENAAEAERLEAALARERELLAR